MAATATAVAAAEAAAAGIVQVTDLVSFENATRVAVPLMQPSASRTILVLAVTLPGRAVGLRVSDNLEGLPRWRQANSDGRTALWYRIRSPQPGVRELVIETANAQTIAGCALAAEVAGVYVGAAVQSMADLFLEAR